jgi:hypothetical protein
MNLPMLTTKDSGRQRVMPNGKLKPPSQIDAADWSICDAQLATSMSNYTQINALLLKFNTTLGQVGGVAE